MREAYIEEVMVRERHIRYTRAVQRELQVELKWAEWVQVEGSGLRLMIITSTEIMLLKHAGVKSC